MREGEPLLSLVLELGKPGLDVLVRELGRLARMQQHLAVFIEHGEEELSFVLVSLGPAFECALQLASIGLDRYVRDIRPSRMRAVCTSEALKTSSASCEVPL